MIKPNHVMVDVETMSTKTNAAIVSIGAVIFDPRHNVVTDKTFYVELNWRDQDFDHDRDIDPETQTWWRTQTEHARKALGGTVNLVEGLTQFRDWLLANNPNDVKVWGNGPTFDISIIESAMAATRIEVPWRFWNIRCCRTIKDMYGTQRGALREGRNVASHNALEDAQQQAHDVCKYWSKLCN